MDVEIDLRYTIPPLLNFILFMFLTFKNQPLSAAFSIDPSFSFSKAAFLLASIFIILLFFIFSVRFRVTPHRINLRPEGFSIALLISVVLSIFLPPRLFWIAFLFIRAPSTWHNIMFRLFACIFRCIARTLHSIPSIFIYNTHNYENPDPVLPQVMEIQPADEPIEIVLEC